MVDSAARSGSRLPDLHRVLPLGGSPGGELPLRALALAVLLAPALVSRRSTLRARALRRAAGLVARLSPLLAGDPHSLGAGELSDHLLLLPRRLLQVVLAGPALLLGRHAGQRLPGRAQLSAHHPEYPPLHAALR